LENIFWPFFFFSSLIILYASIFVTDDISSSFLSFSTPFPFLFSFALSFSSPFPS
jgi:hypothetical protein